MMGRLFALGATLLLAATAAAQSTAIRLIIGEGHKVYTKPGFGNYCMGLGVDRTFNDRLTFGLDATFDVSQAFNDKIIGVDPGHGASEALVAPHLMSINYHTEYALGDNDGTHVYIGSFIGLRRITQEWTLLDYTQNEYSERRINTSKMLVPLGLRLGLRGTTDGGFMDLYGALGLQLGGGKELGVGAAMKDAAYAKTSPLAVTVGLAYGFGW